MVQFYVSYINNNMVLVTQSENELLLELNLYKNNLNNTFVKMYREINNTFNYFGINSLAKNGLFNGKKFFQVFHYYNDFTNVKIFHNFTLSYFQLIENDDSIYTYLTLNVISNDNNTI